MKCNTCGSEDMSYDPIMNNYICDDCGNIQEAMEVEGIETYLLSLILYRYLKIKN